MKLVLLPSYRQHLHLSNDDYQNCSALQPVCLMCTTVVHSDAHTVTHICIRAGLEVLEVDGSFKFFL